MMHIIKKSSANFHIIFVTANHWTISPASLIHSTTSCTISVKSLLLIVTIFIIYLLSYSISAKNGMKTRQRKSAISPVVTSVWETTAAVVVSLINSLQWWKWTLQGAVREHIQRHDKSAVVFSVFMASEQTLSQWIGCFTEIWKYREVEIVVEAGKERIRLAWLQFASHNSHPKLYCSCDFR